MVPQPLGSAQVLLDYAYDGGSNLQGRCPIGRGALLPTSRLLNATKSHPLNAQPTRRVAPQAVQGYATVAAAAPASKITGNAPIAVKAPTTSMLIKSPGPAGQSPPTPLQLLAQKGGAPMPIMPASDGSRGFSAGRGRPLSSISTPTPTAPGSETKSAPAPVRQPPPHSKDAGAVLLSMLQSTRTSEDARPTTAAPPQQMESAPRSRSESAASNVSAAEALLKSLRMSQPGKLKENPARSVSEHQVPQPPGFSGPAPAQQSNQPSNQLPAMTAPRRISQDEVHDARTAAAMAVLQAKPAVVQSEKQAVNVGGRSKSAAERPRHPDIEELRHFVSVTMLSHCGQHTKSPRTVELLKVGLSITLQFCHISPLSNECVVVCML